MYTIGHLTKETVQNHNKCPNRIIIVRLKKLFNIYSDPG